MPSSTVTSKGQITIPAEVRHELGLHAGTRVDFVRTKDGTFEIVPETRAILALKGIVTRPAGPVSLDDMDDAIAGATAGESRAT